MVAICYEAPTRFARYTVSSAAAIPKGTILKLTTPNTAVAASADNDVPGGIAWMEKVASPVDNSTEITAALNGVWGNTISSVAAVTCGFDAVIASSGNLKAYATLDREKGYVIGKFLQSCGTTATVVKFRMNL